MSEFRHACMPIFVRIFIVVAMHRIVVAMHRMQLQQLEHHDDCSQRFSPSSSPPHGLPPRLLAATAGLPPHRW